MPKINPAIAFARMRTDVQRILGAVHVHELRSDFDTLLRILDTLETRVRTQPLRAAIIKPPRITKAIRTQQHKTRSQAIYAAHNAGRMARRNNETPMDNPNDPDSDHVLYNEWAKGFNLENDNINRAAGANSGE